VTRFTLDDAGKKAVSLNLEDSLDLKNGTKTTRTILFKDTNVILCAGTVDTAAIALHSGRQDKKSKHTFKAGHPLAGKGLTDHEIWMAKYWKEDKADEQPVELYCHVEVHGNPALLTICTHAERFHTHGFATSSISCWSLRLRRMRTAP
jgi:choline dehydrogenase-like flavoprotein